MTPVRLDTLPFGLESSTLPLSHCAPYIQVVAQTRLCSPVRAITADIHKVTYGLDARMPVFGEFANNKGADKPVQTDQHLCYWLTGKYHINTCTWLVQAKFQFSS